MTRPWQGEEELIERLRAGDEAAFATLVDHLHGRLSSFARTFTSSATLAEDIVQETWLAVIRGLQGFEGRSSLRTWIFSILAKRARTLATREARRSMVGRELRNAGGQPLPEWEPGKGRMGLWEEAPTPWALEDPALIFQSREVLDVVRAALEELPESQLQVVLLRDVEDLPAADVCNILDLTETNQRVLLHRGRSRIRRAIDRYVRDDGTPRIAMSNGHALKTPEDAPRADVRVPMDPGISGPTRSESEGMR